MTPKRTRAKTRSRCDADITRHNRKFTFRFKDKKLVIAKKEHESEFHVYAKALCYELYHKQYPNMRIEANLEDRYQPDLSAEGYDGTMLFWGECGKVSMDKIEKLFKKYRRARFVFIKEESEIPRFIEQLNKRFKKFSSSPKVDIVTYHEHFHDWYVSPEGDVFMPREEVEITEWQIGEGA